MPTTSDILKRLPPWLVGVALVAIVILVGIQMYRGDALVWNDGAIFAKSCVTIEQHPKSIISQLNGELISVQSGTIGPSEWKKLPVHRSGQAHGITADVEVDLTQFMNPKIFLSRRGNSHIWETRGLSAYPIEGQQPDYGMSSSGFSVIIHGGSMKHILEHANRHH